MLEKMPLLFSEMHEDVRHLHEELYRLNSIHRHPANAGRDTASVLEVEVMRSLGTAIADFNAKNYTYILVLEYDAQTRHWTLAFYD